MKRFLNKFIKCTYQYEKNLKEDPRFHTRYYQLYVDDIIPLMERYGILLSGYINDTHTYVLGPDGKFGYGGKCFPKDVNAFAKMTEGTPLGTLLEHLHELNVHFRGVEEHI